MTMTFIKLFFPSLTYLAFHKDTVRNIFGTYRHGTEIGVWLEFIGRNVVGEFVCL